MRIIENTRGKELIFDNKFSKNLVSKNDLKLTKYLRLKYNLIKFFHLTRFFKKKSWFSLLDWEWGDSEEVIEYINNRKMKQIMLSSTDLKLESIVIYDILPKECINDYKKAYLEFRKKHLEPGIALRTTKNINDSFYNMLNSDVIGHIYNIDRFRINKNSNLSNHYKNFQIKAVGLTESFYIIEYILGIDESINNTLNYILNNDIYKPAICISNDKWWKKGSFCGCSIFDLGSEAKANAIENYLLEIKSIFWEEVNRKFKSKFFSWKSIPSSITIYSSKTFIDKSKEILEIISRSTFNTDKHINKNLFFIPTNNNSDNNETYNSIVITDESLFEKEDGGLYEFMNIEHYLFDGFAEYFVLTSINKNVSNKIYNAQIKINKSVYSKNKYNSLLKLKLNIDKELYFYRRLYKEIEVHKIQKGSNNSIVEKYQEEYINLIEIENPKLKGRVGFIYEYNKLFKNISNRYDLIKSIYSHFDENVQLTESIFNYKIVKYTFWVGIATLFATILLANNSELLRIILNLISNIFMVIINNIKVV